TFFIIHVCKLLNICLNFEIVIYPRVAPHSLNRFRTPYINKGEVFKETPPFQRTMNFNNY
ncbi:hypothetical protein COM50_28205, partial [Bacillus pseudomycoides]